MPEPTKSTRWWITAVFLLLSFVLLNSISHGEPIILHQPLHDLPYKLGDWAGTEHPFDPEILQSAGVSDYTNRLYVKQTNEPVELYVGYYATQRTGDTMHSPKNCLPGSGWDPVRADYATVSIPGGSQIVVNEYVIQRDQQQQLVLYWYQGRGRVIASEYSGKFWTIADAISRNRTDGALVRLNTLINNSEPEAHSKLTEFASRLFPQLDKLIPH